MADPDVPWEIEDPSEEQPAEEEAPPAEGESAAGPPAEGAEGKPAEGEQPSEELPPPPSNEKKKVEFRHWIRPTFLNYRYIYDYRHNYYDDVITYLDKRERGVLSNWDIPRPQTWAERALRTYTSKEISLPSPVVYTYIAFPPCLGRQKTRAYKVAGTYHADHSSAYFKRKFRSILF